MPKQIGLKSFPLNASLQANLQRFANEPNVQSFDLVGSFGPVTKSDGSQHAFFLFSKTVANPSAAPADVFDEIP